MLQQLFIAFLILLGGGTLGYLIAHLFLRVFLPDRTRITQAQLEEYAKLMHKMQALLERQERRCGRCCGIDNKN